MEEGKNIVSKPKSRREANFSGVEIEFQKRPYFDTLNTPNTLTRPFRKRIYLD